MTWAQASDDVGSTMEPTSSLARADVIHADFQTVISRYLQNICTYLFCTTERMLRTITMQISRLIQPCFPIEIDEVWIDRFCVRHDWWRRLQPTSSMSPVWFSTWFTLRYDGTSASGKTSYHNISSSLEAARFVFEIVRSLQNSPGSSAAMLPSHLSNFKAIPSFKLTTSRLRGCTKSCDKTSCHILKRDSGCWLIHNALKAILWNTGHYCHILVVIFTFWLRGAGSRSVLCTLLWNGWQYHGLNYIVQDCWKISVIRSTIIIMYFLTWFLIGCCFSYPSPDAATYVNVVQRHQWQFGEGWALDNSHLSADSCPLARCDNNVNGFWCYLLN